MTHLFNMMMDFIREAGGTSPNSITADENRLTVWPHPEHFWKINQMLDSNTFVMEGEKWSQFQAVSVSRLFGRGYLAIRLEYIAHEANAVSAGKHEGHYISFMIHNPE